MRVIKLLPSQVSPRISVNGIITSAKTALREFCSRKIKEFKLAPTSNTFEFDFHDNRRQCIKSIDRFSAWIKRAVFKRLPFLEFAEKGFFRSGPGKCICINIVPPVHTSSRMFSESVSANVQWIVLQRYSRYLNYLFRKHAIPIQAVTERTWEYPAGEHSRQLKMVEADSRKSVNFPKIQDHYTISFIPGIWIFSSRIRGSRLPDEMKRLTETGKREDSVFTDSVYSEAWAFRQLKDFVGNGPTTIQPGMEQYYCIEKMFMFIPEIIRCMYSLSRKTRYVYQAFRVNPIDLAGDNNGE